MRPLGGTSAVALLRVLLVASVGIPLVLMGVDAWLGYRAGFQDALRDATRVCEVAREHAAKVFNTHELVARRVADALDDLDDAVVRRSEHELHDSMKAMIGGLPQVESFVVLDRDARLLLATAAYPVSRTTDFSDREYFVALKAGQVENYLSEVQISRVDGKVFFGLGRRLLDDEGAFRGVVDIAISPKFFEGFWSTLVGQGAHASGEGVALLRDDGAVLAHWPSLGPDHPTSGAAIGAPRAGALFSAAVAAAPEAGTFFGHVLADTDSGNWGYVYRRVQGYPAYVLVGHSDRSVVATWERRMATHLAVAVPGTLALWLLTWTALRRTRREEAALAQMRAEMQRREAAEAALMQAQRMEAVGQLTGGVAHDFNNLLTIILGNFEMIARTPQAGDRVARLAAAGMAAAQRGAEVIAKLLAFSRRRMISPEIVDVNRLLQEFRPVLRQGITEAIALVYDLDPVLAPASLDPGQLEAAVLNLATNARDAMQGRGTIRIATANRTLGPADLVGQPDVAPGVFVEVAVSDDGPGMEPAVAARAFEPFFTTKEIGRGTGLGLSQVYGFCHQAGGFARIRSTPGRGTVVDLLLPRAARPPAFRAAAAALPALPDAAGQVVLVVEDDPGVRDVAVGNLRGLGYAARMAADAADALAALRTDSRIDILFSDIVMPGGTDGVQLSVQARRLRPGLKVLLVSGYAGGAMDRPIPPGTAILAKPYQRDDLAAALAALSGPP